MNSLLNEKEDRDVIPRASHIQPDELMKASVMFLSHLGLSEQLLQLLLRQQTVVLDKGGHLWGALRLIVNGPMDLHVAMQNCQKLFLSLLRHNEVRQNELSTSNLSLQAQLQREVVFPLSL